MKFENPKMNISMFEVEDVITTSGGGEATTPVNAVTAAQERLSSADIIITF